MIVTADNHTLTFIRHLHFSTPIIHDDPVATSDDEIVKVFKAYFNPASFESYKAMFLPQDWGGFSQEEYEAWQAKLRTQKLYLFQVIHLRDETSHEFLVFQYNMETPDYSIPQSAKFKKVNGAWKHIHVRNDALFGSLNEIGQIKTSILQSTLLDAKSVLRLNQITEAQKSTHIEKFNRDAVFETIRTLLVQKGVASSDIETAKTHFTTKDNQAFVEFITMKYDLDDIDFMEEVNTLTGVRLFNFTRAQKN